MGFKLDRIYVLEFEGDLQGAIVKLRATSVDTVEQIRTSDKNQLKEMLADHVTEWNLEDRHGNPLPISSSAIGTHMEEAVLAEICLQWYRAAVGVTAPLDAGSTNIGRDLEETISMTLPEGLEEKVPANLP